MMTAGLLAIGSPATAATGAADSTATAGNDYDKWRIGSYGEMLATFKDYGLNRFYGGSTGNTKVNHNEISIPRFILQGEYKITPKWILSAEIEFEAGGTGSAIEMEAQSGSENGEYETEAEKGGEVASNSSTSRASSHRSSTCAWDTSSSPWD